MASTLFATGLLGLGLHSLIGVAIGIVALAGFVSGIIDVTFEERFPLLGGFVGLMMMWWIALAVLLHRDLKSA